MQPVSREIRPASPVHHDVQDAIAELHQTIADNLVEGEDGDVSPFEVLEALMNIQAHAVNWNSSSRLPPNGTVIPNSEKSVQVTNIESEENVILIELLKLNLEAVLKELEVTKPVCGFVV